MNHGPVNDLKGSPKRTAREGVGMKGLPAS